MTSNPRREWKSFLCVAKWSVRLRIRSLRIATWTSGEPVSRSLVAYSAMSVCLRSAVMDTDLILSTIDDSRRSETAVFDPSESDHGPTAPNTHYCALDEQAEFFPYICVVGRHSLPTT